jgi:hypothetical protein
VDVLEPPQAVEGDVEGSVVLGDVDGPREGEGLDSEGGLEFREGVEGRCFLGEPSFLLEEGLELPSPAFIGGGVEAARVDLNDEQGEGRERRGEKGEVLRRGEGRRREKEVGGRGLPVFLFAALSLALAPGPSRNPTPSILPVLPPYPHGQYPTYSLAHRPYPAPRKVKRVLWQRERKSRGYLRKLRGYLAKGMLRGYFGKG